MDTNIIGVGVLAHNEEAGITKMLESLFKQKSFLPPEWLLEIIIVANGCSDRTAELAQQTCAKALEKIGLQGISCRVEQVEVAGKCNAWNLYVHKFSNAQAKYLILMDADILIPEDVSLIWKMVEELENHPSTWIATDMPMKDCTAIDGRHLYKRLVQKAPASSLDPYAICGQCYCGRAEVLRQVQLPGELPVEDGFLRALVLTKFFTENEQFNRIRRVSNAYHLFEPPANFLLLLSHEKRLLVGNTVNSFLFEFFWSSCTADHNAVDLMQSELAKDKDWLRKFVEISVSQKGWWVINNKLIFARLWRLKNLPILQALRKLPTGVMASLLMTYIALQANRELRRNRGVGYW